MAHFAKNPSGKIPETCRLNVKHATQPESFFPAALIAVALDTYKRSVHRQAARENWPRRRSGNQFLLRPPPKSLGRCRRLARLLKPRGLRAEIITPERRAEALRVVHRLTAVMVLAATVETGTPHEQALRQVSHLFTLKISTASLRRWTRRFTDSGVAGLAELKRGRSGRKRQKPQEEMT